MGSMIQALAAEAADHLLVEKLASDTQIDTSLVYQLADLAGMSVNTFTKAAYANPAGYVGFLKEAAKLLNVNNVRNSLPPGLQAKIDALLKRRQGPKLPESGATPPATPPTPTSPPPTVGGAGGVGESASVPGAGMMSGVASAKAGINGLGAKIKDIYNASRGKADSTPGGYLGRTTPVDAKTHAALPETTVKGNALDRFLAGTRFGGSRAGRNATLGTGVVGTGLVGNAALSGGSPSAGASGEVGSGLASGVGSGLASGAGAAKPDGIANILSGGGGASAPSAGSGGEASPAAGGGGMSSGLKALLAAGGVSAGALGVGALASRNKGKKKKEVRSSDAFSVEARQALIKVAAARYREIMANRFCTYLDKLAAYMPLEKAAAVRKVQAAVAEGQPLSLAIKVAYPHLNGEQRGILATRLVKAASSAKMEEKPGFKGKKVGRQEYTVKMQDGAVDRMKQMSS